MKKNKIFLLEDHPIHREVIFDGLEDVGYEVMKAKNVEEAHQVLKKFTPDLFILDIVIENIRNRGIQFAEKLLENSRFKDIPVLFISAHLDEKSIIEHIPGNLKGNILPKPFDFEKLLGKIREVLKM
jgi:DNA-binding response OmpR family regulator